MKVIKAWDLDKTAEFMLLKAKKHYVISNHLGSEVGTCMPGEYIILDPDWYPYVINRNQIRKVFGHKVMQELDEAA